MSFVIATARNKRKGDLVASFPLVSQYLKCFKHLLIDPDSLCAIAPGKKNYDRYNKGSKSYELVGSSPKSKLKLT
jgi:regulator of sigma D